MGQNSGGCAEGLQGCGAKVLVRLGENSSEERRVAGLHSVGALPSSKVEKYSGLSSVVVYYMHILDFNQRRDE